MSELATSLRTAIIAHGTRLETAVAEILDRHAAPVVHGWHSPLADAPPEAATLDHPVWGEIEPTGERPGFLPIEFNRPEAMDAHFLRLVHRIRLDIWLAVQAGELPHDVPMRIISDARTSGGASASEHFNRPCRAVDLQVWNAYERGVIDVAAVRRGIVRKGAYPGRDRRGEAGVPVFANDASGYHLDASTRNPSPRCWTRY